ncbi:MAG: PucR family transcriptional regulator [Lachnospiraceae bacterium]|nr:PucR family transcriptional regulator [Lachnospiraceae bacterium]
MISNQMIQNSIDDVRAITRIDLCVLDLNGAFIAATFEMEEMPENTVESFVQSPAESQSLQGYNFFKVYDEEQLEYILVARGISEDAYMIGKLAACQLQALIVAYKERFDKNNFIQNLLLDNLLLVDIYNRAKKLHIEQEACRVVFLIETKYEKDTVALETVRSLFGNSAKDFITAVDERNIVLLKEVSKYEDYESLESVARMLVDMLNAEAMTQVRVSYGTIVQQLKDVSKSYKEAKMAMDVGRIFYVDRTIMAYNTLGIGRLIYQLPMSLCEMFMHEVFGENTPDTFDEETLSTIHKFFDNSLNVSETARQLFVHRNTLVYRLEKLQKTTGLDIRVFEDALTFRIALMVANYMKYLDTLR